MNKTLQKYFPEEIVPLVESIIKEKNIHFTITKDRKSKSGDYRSPFRKSSHRISVNSSLNKYSFTITFFHEYAHLLTWENFKNKVSPHGAQWKSIFSKIIEKLLKKNIFPEDIHSALESYSINPKASTQSDIYLSHVLKKYDIKNTFTESLIDIKHGSIFEIENGRKFTRGEMKRTRIWCEEISTKAIFAFNPNAEVIPITS